MIPIKSTWQDPECMTAAEEAEVARRERIKAALEDAIDEVSALRESIALLLSLDGDAGYDYLQSRSKMVPYAKDRALRELADSLKEWRRALNEE